MLAGISPVKKGEGGEGVRTNGIIHSFLALSSEDGLIRVPAWHGCFDLNEVYCYQRQLVSSWQAWRYGMASLASIRVQIKPPIPFLHLQYKVGKKMSQASTLTFSLSCSNQFYSHILSLSPHTSTLFSLLLSLCFPSFLF